MAHRRLPCLLSCLLLFLSGCSSESDPASGTGTDAAVVDAANDAHDASFEEAAAEDVTADVTSSEAAVFECPLGSWGSVPNTKCDLIAQDCESQLLTCYPNLQGGTPGTSCTYIGYGAKGRGAVCDSNSECATGLVCLAGNCTPFCCPDYQYEICGPGGRCDINFNIGAGHSVMICGYSEPCTLWAHDCPVGDACQPVTDDGSAACTPPASGEFVGEGNACSSRNDCGDSQRCISLSGQASVCRYYCKLGDSPWDAGAPNAAPGDGGCPVDQSCLKLTGLPDWLGVCRPDA